MTLNEVPTPSNTVDTNYNTLIPKAATLSKKNLVPSDYGYPVNKKVIGKPINRAPHFWTTLDEWEIITEDEAVQAQLDGYDVIWSLVSKELLEARKSEFLSGQYLNQKKRKTDKNGNRSISNKHITCSDKILIDFDQCPYSQIPQSIIDNAWLMHPSASQVKPVYSGDKPDVPKMHIIHKTPQPVRIEYVNRYRKAYLERICQGLKYDEKCIDAKREFYGLNPEWKDKKSKFIKFQPHKVIDLKLHNEILREAMKPLTNEEKGKREAEKPKRGRPALTDAEKVLGKRVDEYLLENFDLGEIVNGIFPEEGWEQKGVSSEAYDQYECVYPLLDEANNPTAFAVIHSKKTGRLLCMHKGIEFTANLYEFYVRYKMAKEGKENADTMDISEFLKGERFKIVVEEICDSLNIDRFEFGKKKKTRLSLASKILVNEKIAKLNSDKYRFHNAKDGRIHYVYSEETGTWEQNKKAAFFENHWVCLIDEIDAELMQDGFKAGISPTYLIAQMHENHKKEGKDLKEPMSIRGRYLPLADCDYDLETGKFKSFAPEHYILSRLPIKRTDYQVEKGEALKNRYLEAFQFMTDEKTAKLMYAYKVAEVLRLGKVLNKVLTICGNSGTGKGAFVRLFEYLMGNSSIAPSVVEISRRKVESRFALSGVSERTSALHLNEFQMKTQEDVLWFKGIFENKKTVTTERKNENSQEVLFDFVSYFSAQDYLNTHNDSGVERRMLPINIGLPTHAGEPGKHPYKDHTWCQELNELFFNEENVTQFFLYILHEASKEEAKAIYDEYINSDEAKQNKEDVTKRESVLKEIFEDMEVEVTAESTDYVLANDFKEQIKNELRRREDITRCSTKYLNSLIVQYLELFHAEKWETMKGYVSKGEQINTAKKMKGKVVRVIVGLKWNQQRNSSEF